MPSDSRRELYRTVRDRADALGGVAFATEEFPAGRWFAIAVEWETGREWIVEGASKGAALRALAAALEAECARREVRRAV